MQLNLIVCHDCIHVVLAGQEAGDAAEWEVLPVAALKLVPFFPCRGIAQAQALQAVAAELHLVE